MPNVMETFPLNLNVNSFSPLPLLSLNHLSIFLVKKLQPLSFHTKANLEKKLSFDISFKLLAEPKWHCDTQSLNQIINVSLTTFLRCIGSALAKSINSSTSGYLYCMLFSSCDMLVKTSPCTVPGKHFCFKFPYFRLNFNGILDSLFICEKLPIVSNCFTKCFLAVIRFIALYICKSAAICSSIGEFTRQKC